MFVDVFEKPCEENGIVPSRVLDNLGITRSAYSRWSKGGSPSNDLRYSLRRINVWRKKAPTIAAEADVVVG